MIRLCLYDVYTWRRRSSIRERRLVLPTHLGIRADGITRTFCYVETRPVEVLHVLGAQAVYDVPRTLRYTNERKGRRIGSRLRSKSAMKSAHERGRPVTGLGPKNAKGERRLSSEGHRNFELGASSTPAGRHDSANQGRGKSIPDEPQRGKSDAAGSRQDGPAQSHRKVLRRAD